MENEYYDFLKQKRKYNNSSGIDIEIKQLSNKLFDWQKQCVKWALKKGKCALFEACGLGKTMQQLEWANIINKETGQKVLIVAPLGVAVQTAKEEAPKIGIKVTIIRKNEDIQEGINIINYEMLDNIDTSQFIGVVLDESSILKNFTGKVRNKITAAFKNTKYKLCCTATPAPNDYIELLNHADFLDVMSTSQALSIYFINDMKTGKWRIKGHATEEFWKWVCNWALNIEKPSDIGFENGKYILPKLNEYEELVGKEEFGNDEIKMSATSFYKEKNKTLEERVKKVKEIISKHPNEQYLVWCDTNEESERLKMELPESVEVRGSDKKEFKEEASLKFKDNEIQILISKPKIFGYGMNFQNCRNVIFCGLTFSYENYYQALRRTYRFGQEKEVNSYIVLGKTEKTILDTIRRKEEQQYIMKNSMSVSVKELQILEINSQKEEIKIDKEKILLPSWI